MDNSKESSWGGKLPEDYFLDRDMGTPQGLRCRLQAMAVEHRMRATRLDALREWVPDDLSEDFCRAIEYGLKAEAESAGGPNV